MPLPWVLLKYRRSNWPKAIIAVPKVILAIPKVVLGVPKVILGVPKVVLGVPKVVLGVPKVVLGFPLENRAKIKRINERRRYRRFPATSTSK